MTGSKGRRREEPPFDLSSNTSRDKEKGRDGNNTERNIHQTGNKAAEVKMPPITMS